MDGKVTLETILKTFVRWVEDKEQIPPSRWLDGVFKISILSEELDNDLLKARISYNKVIAELVKNGDSVAKATILANTSVEYEAYMMLDAYKKRIVEFIRITKKRADLPNWDS